VARGWLCRDYLDNGSEFVNYRVAGLLEKLRIGEFTKSRANGTTDNALVEGKNGAVVRKYIGYGHLAAEHAEAFQPPEVWMPRMYSNCGASSVIMRGESPIRISA
jgi:hypothetical protein